MTITFEITDEHEADAREQLAQREGIADIHALFRLESFHNLKLTDTALAEKKIATITERLKDVDPTKLDAAKLAEIEAVIATITKEAAAEPIKG